MEKQEFHEFETAISLRNVLMETVKASIPFTALLISAIDRIEMYCLNSAKDEATETLIKDAEILQSNLELFRRSQYILETSLLRTGAGVTPVFWQSFASETQQSPNRKLGSREYGSAERERSSELYQSRKFNWELFQSGVQSQSAKKHESQRETVEDSNADNLETVCKEYSQLFEAMYDYRTSMTNKSGLFSSKKDATTTFSIRPSYEPFDFTSTPLKLKESETKRREDYDSSPVNPLIRASAVRRYGKTRKYRLAKEDLTEYNSPVEGRIETVDETGCGVYNGLTTRPSLYVRVTRPHKNEVTILQSRFRQGHQQFREPIKMQVNLDQDGLEIKSKGLKDLRSAELNSQAVSGGRGAGGANSKMLVNEKKDALDLLATSVERRSDPDGVSKRLFSTVRNDFEHEEMTMTYTPPLFSTSLPSPPHRDLDMTPTDEDLKNLDKAKIPMVISSELGMGNITSLAYHNAQHSPKFGEPAYPISADFEIPKTEIQTPILRTIAEESSEQKLSSREQTQRSADPLGSNPAARLEKIIAAKSGSSTERNEVENLQFGKVSRNSHQVSVEEALQDESILKGSLVVDLKNRTPSQSSLDGPTTSFKPNRSSTTPLEPAGRPFQEAAIKLKDVELSKEYFKDFKVDQLEFDTPPQQAYRMDAAPSGLLCLAGNAIQVFNPTPAGKCKLLAEKIQEAAGDEPFYLKSSFLSDGQLLVQDSINHDLVLYDPLLNEKSRWTGGPSTAKLPKVKRSWLRKNTFENQSNVHLWFSKYDSVSVVNPIDSAAIACDKFWNFDDMACLGLAAISTETGDRIAGIGVNSDELYTLHFARHGSPHGYQTTSKMISDQSGVEPSATNPDAFYHIEANLESTILLVCKFSTASKNHKIEMFSFDEELKDLGSFELGNVTEKDDKGEGKDKGEHGGVLKRMQSENIFFFGVRNVVSVLMLADGKLVELCTLKLPSAGTIIYDMKHLGHQLILLANTPTSALWRITFPHSYERYHIEDRTVQVPLLSKRFAKHHVVKTFETGEGSLGKSNLRIVVDEPRQRRNLVFLQSSWNIRASQYRKREVRRMGFLEEIPPYRYG